MTGKPGFQGSRTTGMEVAHYAQGDDPILRNEPGKLVFSGRSNLPGAAPAVTAVSTSKSLGAAAGTFTVTVKAPTPMGQQHKDLRDCIVDDDWMDIVANVNGRKTHLMRGHVGALRWQRTTSSDGSPDRTYTISGKDFGCILEKTFAWFNDYTLENYLGQKTREIWGPQQTDAPFIIADPSKAVRQAVFGFLETLTGAGHPDWRLPPSMAAGGATFPDAAKYVSSVSAKPERFTVSRNFVNPSGAALWEFVQQLSDPMLTELFCDLGSSPDGAQLNPEIAVPFNPDGVPLTTMSVFYRDKPFPTRALGLGSPWFSLPTVTVSPHMISSAELGRSGDERITAVMLAPVMSNEVFRKILTSPIWDAEGIARHGMRQLSVESQYRAREEQLYPLTLEQRTKLVDWHALNAYLYSGSISFKVLVPEIRIGCRLVVSDGNEATQETYYVEQVGHSWSATSGGSTNVAVTRGWVGSKQSYLQALTTAAARFQALIER